MARTTLGFPHRVPHWMGSGRRMGQALSPPERSRTLADLAEAQNKMAAVQAWADAQGDLNGALGNDAARFRQLRSQVDSAAAGATAALVQLQRPDPADWDVSARSADVQAYVAGANELSEIVRRVAPDKWGALLTAIVTGAIGLIPGILAPGPETKPPATVPPVKPPATTDDGWPWWAYGLAGAGGLLLLGGAIALLAPKAAPRPARAPVPAMAPARPRMAY